MRGAPADGGGILQLFGREVAMCLDDEARGALERAVCGIAWYAWVLELSVWERVGKVRP